MKSALWGNTGIRQIVFDFVDLDSRLDEALLRDIDRDGILIYEKI